MVTSEIGIARTILELKPTTDRLFADIIKSPDSYSSHTNPLVAPIHLAWKNVREGGDADLDLKTGLESPRSFISRVAPEPKKVKFGQMLRGLGHRIGQYMITEGEEEGVKTFIKKGRFATDYQPPQGEDWVQLDSTDWQDIFAKKGVVTEASDLCLETFGIGFHSTSSAALNGISKKGALVSSREINEAHEEVVSGEVFGTNQVHSQVYVYQDKIADSYGTPRWFDEYEVVFAISIARQEKYLERQNKKMGIFSNSEGWQIGDNVPLENINFIAVPFAHLPDAEKWVSQDCPGTKIVSREALYLKYGK